MSSLKLGPILGFFFISKYSILLSDENKRRIHALCSLFVYRSLALTRGWTFKSIIVSVKPSFPSHLLMRTFNQKSNLIWMLLRTSWDTSLSLLHRPTWISASQIFKPDLTSVFFFFLLTAVNCVWLTSQGQWSLPALVTDASAISIIVRYEVVLSSSTLPLVVEVALKSMDYISMLHKCSIPVFNMYVYRPNSCSCMYCSLQFDCVCVSYILNHICVTSLKKTYVFFKVHLYTSWKLVTIIFMSDGLSAEMIVGECCSSR